VADRKITDLTALTTPASADVLPIVDVSEAAAADKNKKITVGELFKGVPDGTAAAPAIAFESDDGNGIFLSTTDTVGIATNGSSRMTVSTTAVTSTLPVIVPDGTAAAPSVAFTGSGTDTGIYSPGVDQVAVAPGCTLTLQMLLQIIFASKTPEATHYLVLIGSVGIGTTSPGYPLHVFSSTSTVGIRVDGGGDSIVSFANAGSAVGAVGIAAGNIAGGGSGNIGIQSGSSLLFATGGVNEKARLDDAGRLLVGTATTLAQGEVIQGAGSNESLGLMRFRDDSAGPEVNLYKTRATSVAHSVVSSGDYLGSVNFRGSDGTNYLVGARIEAIVDATPGSNDLPSRLVFSTTADGASSPTERMRITSGGLQLP
jgi:hypothetical protein